VRVVRWNYSKVFGGGDDQWCARVCCLILIGMLKISAKVVFSAIKRLQRDENSNNPCVMVEKCKS
jgi:hypothetical protein